MVTRREDRSVGRTAHLRELIGRFELVARIDVRLEIIFRMLRTGEDQLAIETWR